MERQQGKEEGGNFCVVGHFQFTRFDLPSFRGRAEPDHV